MAVNQAALPHLTAAMDNIRTLAFELDRPWMPGSNASELIPDLLGSVNGHLTEARVSLLEHPDAVLTNGGFGPTMDERLAGHAFDAIFLARAYTEHTGAVEAVRAGVHSMHTDVRSMIRRTLPVEHRPFIPSGEGPKLYGGKNPPARPGA